MTITLNNIDWNAISAISTALGVLVALFLPIISQSRKNRKINRMVQNELRLNCALLDNAVQERNSTRNIEMIKQIESEIWESFHVQYSETTSPELFHHTNQSYINLIKLKNSVMNFESQYIISVKQFLDLQKMEEKVLNYIVEHIEHY